MSRTPLARMASSTLKVAMVFCSEILAGVLQAEADIGIGRQMEDDVAAARRGRQPRKIEKVSFDEGEIRIRARRGKEFRHAGRKIVIADNAHARRQQAVHQIAADEARRSRHQCGPITKCGRAHVLPTLGGGALGSRVDRELRSPGMNTQKRLQT